MKSLLSLLIRAYRRFISPMMPPSCRYWPSCSEYALDALQEHGAMRGVWLTANRFCRCHPWGGHGFDPVPPRARGTLFYRSFPCGTPLRIGLMCCHFPCMKCRASFSATWARSARRSDLIYEQERINQISPSRNEGAL